jgi:threonine dehydratase
VDARFGDRSGFLKLETLQPTGSFKVRGALATASRIEPGGRIMAVSAGNHALGIAHASTVLGVPATVVLAETASPAKLAALRRYPIEVITHGATYDEAEEHALRLADAADGGMSFVSGYNDPKVIAGQSTVLDEIIDELPDRPLTVVVPVGGGGLLAGICLRAAERATTDVPIRIVGVEAAASRAASSAVAAGKTVEVEVGDTIADGLAGNLEPGSITVEIISRCAPRLVTVSEDEIHAGIRFLAASHGLVAEGAGAAATAAILAGKVPEHDGSTLVALVTGRNIALPRLAAILAG